MSSTTDRRKFLKATAALAATPYWFTGSAAQAADDSAKPKPLNIGAIGLGVRGRNILKQASQLGNVVAICDLDSDQTSEIQSLYGGKPSTYSDYRKVLERDDIDVILNATPDHWHTAINIAACKSGKDVYTEKPLTLTIDEGKILSKVVKDTGRVVQVGTQQRSIPQFQQAVELVRNGRVGKLKQVWVSLPYCSAHGGPYKTTSPPKSLDWDQYQGQAPVHDYRKQRTHTTFRWWSEYSGGIVTDWGNHHVDIAHWGMDCEMTGPMSVEARGLFPNPKGPEYYNTPDRFFSRMRYANGIELLYFSSMNSRQAYGDVEKHVPTTPEQLTWLFGDDVPEEIKAYDRNGVMFIGETGRLFVNRKGIYGKPVEELKEHPLSDDAWRIPACTDHMANFFQCVQTRDEPISPVRIQHRTITACHLTNIAIQTGRKLTWDPVAQQIRGDDEAQAMQRRTQRAPYGIES